MASFSSEERTENRLLDDPVEGTNEVDEEHRARAVPAPKTLKPEADLLSSNSDTLPTDPAKLPWERRGPPAGNDPVPQHSSVGLADMARE